MIKHKDTLTVNIVVADRNEAPGMPMAAPPGASISGPGSEEVMEGHTGMVATYRVRGSDETPGWSLTGDDRGDFEINQDGVVTFRNVPDFEAAADNGRDNEYEITVNARIGTETLTRDVMVMVTNEDDPGSVSLDSTAPRVGTPITARVTDPDGGVTGESWQWDRSADGSTGWAPIVRVSSGTYTPVVADVGNYLRADA